jgi:hypothetical protein
LYTRSATGAHNHQLVDAPDQGARSNGPETWSHAVGRPLVRDTRWETEPQESAGCNSFAGNAWTCSWGPNSVDSTDQTRSVSQSSIGDEVEQRTQNLSSQEPSRRDPTSNVAHRGAVNGRTDARGVSANSSLV